MDEAGRAVKGFESTLLAFRASISCSFMETKEFLPPPGEFGSTMIVLSPIAEDGGVSRGSCKVRRLLDRAELPLEDEMDFAGGLSGERAGIGGDAGGRGCEVAGKEAWSAVFECERGV
jgi:hypothetical protein